MIRNNFTPLQSGVGLGSHSPPEGPLCLQPAGKAFPYLSEAHKICAGFGESPVSS